MGGFMTRDDIIHIAREAGYPHVGLKWNDPELAFLERFAALVSASEREACAIMCEVHAAAVINDGKQPAWAIAHECAAAIRARGAA